MNKPTIEQNSSVQPDAHLQLKKEFAPAIHGRHELEMLTLKQVAELLQLSPITVTRLADSGRLPVVRVCRKRLFKRRDVLDLIEKARSDTGTK